MENKYLKRIMRVLPVKIKWQIIKVEQTQMISQELLEGFFSWYMNQKRIYLYMDTSFQGVISGNYAITDVDYILTPVGSDFTYTMVDRFNSDRKINFKVKIANNSIEIVKKWTEDNFQKKYMVRYLGHFNHISMDVDKTLFTSLKDLMSTTLLTRLDAAYSSNYDRRDIYEAIPSWIL